MKILGGILCVTVALLASGCSIGAAAEYELVGSDVPADSVPAFVAEPQDDDDVIDEFDVSTVGIDPASLRFQGEWNGTMVFLGVAGGSVWAVTYLTDEPELGGAGGSAGNSVFGFDTLPGDGGVSLQYIPHGTSEVPDGWRALSDWVIVHEEADRS